MKLWQGNEACVEGAIAAGARFYAGYPITPSTEIAEIASRRLPPQGGKFIQMEDEIGGIAAMIGASVGGAKAFTATSGPGFSLMQENLGYAAMAEIPCVLVNVQRMGPSTGVATAPAQGDVMQARWGTHGDHPAIVLCPSSVEEVYYLTIEAFNLSEMLRQPVILLMDEVVGHMRENIAEPDRTKIRVIDRSKPEPDQLYLPYAEDSDVSPFAPFGEGYAYNITGLAHDEKGFPTNDGEVVRRLLDRLHQKIENNLSELPGIEEAEAADADLVILCYGCTARPAREAVRLARDSGLSVGYVRLRTLWPFPYERIAALADKKSILVPEMNMGQIIGEVERAVKGKTEVVGLWRYDGELFNPEEILKKIREVI
ncbi:2-oxoacid:acceptor oxidoreductase subunit alpha [Dethiobacter alkaliphilus]|uniref:Pyruvate flavodoxin/ferredoxin oxidoreductase domain protein n=1 Tax=Dethiobacter alkaliphilus AHT 1 TaxID=555088 RepID=C0GDF4_DETAL|nr:2-oxoacid:acceptor oxidoreductase subunit alpha [Dethiobacter alkaliphilus]EEG78675.1 pyruvate flavodoxin/ferredoxin oxidoreductase domain protein [Dethiobacter alkaliphilus AHT 1]